MIARPDPLLRTLSPLLQSLFLLMLLLLASPARSLADAAPPLSLETADGESITLPRRHEGVDVYLFWATWCPYCKALMPHLQSIRDEYGDAVTVFALQIRDEEDPGPFFQQNGFDFVLIPEADDAMGPYGMRSTPGLVLVDGAGQVRFNLYEIALQDPPGFAELSNRAKAARRGPAWAALLRAEIDQLLAEGGPDHDF